MSKEDVLQGRYSITIDNTQETSLSSTEVLSSTDINSKSSFDNKGYSDYYHYPKIIYKVYERLGINLVLSNRFSTYSYGSKEEALLAIKRIGDINVVYVLLEEVSLFGYSQ